MDPNGEDGPRKVEIAEVDVDFGLRVRSQSELFGSTENPVVPPPLQPPLASTILAGLYGPPPGSHGNDSAGPSAPTHAVDQTQDAERIQRLQEEEFQRRLRGEYENAQRRLGDVVSGNMDRPLRLTSIRLVPPPPTTRTNFLASLISPFLAPPSPHLPPWLHVAPPPPRTLHEVLLTTRAMMQHIDKFGVFDMEKSGVRLENRRGGDDDEVELVLSLRERSRLFLKAGTEVGGGEGGGNITARLRNALGGGETLEGQASIGTKTKSAYQASLTTPLFASPLLSFALSAFSFDRDNSAFASHREQASGGRAKLSAIEPYGLHDLTYEYIKRDINHLSPEASISVRQLARESTKSSLSHTFTSDTRDDPWLGTSGRLLKITHEYAGLPGSSSSVRFFKSLSQSQFSRALFEGSNITYSLSSLTSILYPLGPRSRPTELPDRLFLGGPNSLRGWRVGGMGLRDGPDSLGGELSWGGGLSVFAPIWPGKGYWPVRGHGSLNVGKVVGYDRDRTFGDNMMRMYRNPNVSVGLGLMYRLDPIRVEVNFSMPLIGRKGERTARGFGVGVGIEFL
ncbi:surface antigen-domain-containing protein [Kockovaella imperatae]|uniref:Surface antigen-domain-containing protein n=1 Tax=Kockovaella imperatae TaxID=4999 RepID=A0A1Y1UMZ4_9TREE|nr:surface antigen-domain-containing protein [Kockovaella imperatae]ORX38854.1 surface antigen-domain-containing protein [Kockovaella imperatae]